MNAMGTGEDAVRKTMMRHEHEHTGGCDDAAENAGEHANQHAEIDFFDFSPNQCEKKGKKLRNAADGRGWLHQVEGA